MTRWVTKAVKEQLARVPNAKLVEEGAGEHYTTQRLTYEVDGCEDRLYVRGFVTGPDGIPRDDDVEIEMVELTTEYSDGEDSQEALNVLTRAQMQVELMRMGHAVVRSLDPYF